MSERTYEGNPGAYKIEAIMDALVEQLGTGEGLRVEGAPDGSWVKITTEGAADTVVQNVITAHDPVQLSKSEQETIDREIAIDALAGFDAVGVQQAALAAKDLAELQGIVANLVEALGYLILTQGRSSGV